MGAGCVGAGATGGVFIIDTGGVGCVSTDAGGEDGNGLELLIFPMNHPLNVRVTLGGGKPVTVMLLAAL